MHELKQNMVRLTDSLDRILLWLAKGLNFHEQLFHLPNIVILVPGHVKVNVNVLRQKSLFLKLVISYRLSLNVDPKLHKL